MASKKTDKKVDRKKPDDEYHFVVRMPYEMKGQIEKMETAMDRTRNWSIVYFIKLGMEAHKKHVEEMQHVFDFKE